MNATPSKLTLLGTYAPRSSIQQPHKGGTSLLAPGESAVQELNPQRVRAILDVTGWSRLEKGSFNLDLSDRQQLDTLLALSPVWTEDGASVVYPPSSKHIPLQRGPYLYYCGWFTVQGQRQQVLVRRPTNPIMNRVELFAPVAIATALGYKGGETLEVVVSSK